MEKCQNVLNVCQVLSCQECRLRQNPDTVCGRKTSLLTKKKITLKVAETKTMDLTKEQTRRTDSNRNNNEPTWTERDKDHLITGAGEDS